MQRARVGMGSPRPLGRHSMKNFIKKIIEKIKHEHEYRKVDWAEREDRDMRYSIRKYECQTCGKTTWVDGRYDPYE